MNLRARNFVAAVALASAACTPNPATVQFGVETSVADEGRTHVPEGTTVQYEANPPASGPHWPTPAAPGFYDNALPPERWVHNLEHGYMVVLFDCGGACDSVLTAQLQALVQQAPSSEKYGYAKIVITPYSGLPSGAQICAVAWDVQMCLERFDSVAILDFYGRHLDQGPEDAP